MTNDGLPIHCGGSLGSGNFHAWQGPLVCMDALNWSVYRPCLFPKACTKASPYEGPFRDDAPSWCWAPFEPEGILRATAPLLLFSLWSLEFILDMSFIHMKDHSSRLLHWVGMGITLLVLGIILHLTDGKIRSQLYTVSYVCVTSGAAALVFPAFYVMIDILNWKYLFLPLEWIGMNAMLVYVMAAAGIFAGFINGWYYEDPHNTLNNIEIVKTDGIFVSFQLIALLVRHHRRKLPEYDVVPEE
ncbi:hypothetical protein CQW23_27391 [Capsicum baccatum]|uniref:Uncharacterized protein n=1 Tax=Capsicum baccatum TaxID=33114 RepID=A0A2G2VDH7_CAPBA|nr:hypothetical protein CQW23_27391 [Capsicum baccatum]